MGARKKNTRLGPFESRSSALFPKGFATLSLCEPPRMSSAISREDSKHNNNNNKSNWAMPNSSTGPSANPPKSAAKLLPQQQQQQQQQPQQQPQQQQLQPQKPASKRHKYLVASHSVRITKFGYAIDPIELRYAEILNKLTPAERRLSDASLDSGQLAHRMLTLIRGFWSQSAWPRGRPMSSKQQQAQEQQLQQLFRVAPNENPIEALVTYFRLSSFYPHKRTLGQMSMAPVSPPPPPPFSSTTPTQKPARS